jgi:hypothetical protein
MVSSRFWAWRAGLANYASSPLHRTLEAEPLRLELSDPSWLSAWAVQPLSCGVCGGDRVAINDGVHRLVCPFFLGTTPRAFSGFNSRIQ